MKKLALIAMILVSSLGMSMAQNVTRHGNNFVAEKTSSAKQAQETATSFTYTDTDGQTYPIFLSRNGRAYIKRVSKKTGNEYKKYLDEETSRTICRELGVEYKEKAK